MSQHDISSLWSGATESKKPPSNSSATVGKLSARNLSIVWSSDSRYWKSTTTDIGGLLVDAANLVKVCWLQVDGKYEIKKLSKGVHYEVMFVVKLLDSLNIKKPVTFSLTPPGECTQMCRKKLMKMPKNQILGIVVGDFQAGEVFGCSEIKFSMVNVDECWKQGLVVMGVLVVPKL
ncbi:lectin-like [Apium graveolens]|uniref:lectin-like n=1 Tax=Apium graveolens TaxID=4045 RepID=UPI003D7B3E83